MNKKLKKIVIFAGMYLCTSNMLGVAIAETSPIEADSRKQIMTQSIEPQNIYLLKSSKTIVSPLEFEITAYTLAEDECGKSIHDKEYGITSSMTKAKQWRTIAAPKSIPYGTKIYIPYFKDYPNGGYFTVEDRGVSPSTISEIRNQLAT